MYHYYLIKPYLLPKLYNFGHFQRFFLVLVLFESQSITLFRVFNTLCSSLYLQICIFYFGISKYLNFTRELWPEVQVQISKTMRCLHPSTRETSEIDSKGQITRVAWFARASGYGASYNFFVFYQGKILLFK
jgi:hypothetical protein